MSLTNAPGFGTGLAWGAADFTSPVVITGLVDIEPGKLEIAMIKLKTFGSTGQTVTVQPGWREPGKWKFTMYWDHTQVTALEASIGQMKGWTITYNDGTAIGGTSSSTEKFQGSIAGKGSKIPLDGVTAYEWEVQQSGPSTFTAGS